MSFENDIDESNELLFYDALCIPLSLPSGILETIFSSKDFSIAAETIEFSDWLILIWDSLIVKRD